MRTLTIIALLLSVAALPSTENWQGFAGGADAAVCAVDHDGSDFIAIGEFTVMGGASHVRAARWNGTAWRSMGNPAWSSTPTAYLRTAGGTIYVAAGAVGGSGSTHVVHRWDGTNWVAVGGPFNSVIYDLVEGVDGLYAVGDFTTVSNVITARRIARYAGGVWAEVGGGLSSTAYAIDVHPLGGVVVGGDFATAGAVTTNRLAWWNGAVWSAFGAGANARVRSLAAVGGTLYVGGTFTSCAATTTDSGVVRLDTGSGMWNALNGRGAITHNAMYVQGSTVYVAHSTGLSIFSGGSWSTRLTGGNVRCVTTDVTGDVYVGGDWSGSGTLRSPRVAKWDLTPPTVSIGALAPDDLAIEGGRAAIVQVILSSAESADVLLLMDRTAASGAAAEDVVPLSVPVRVPAGQSTYGVAVTAYDDAIREVEESFYMEITGGSGYVEGFPLVVTLRIQDNDAALDPAATLRVLDAAADEATFGTAAFEILLSAPPTGPIQVAYAISGTATPGSDYVAWSGHASFLAGVTSQAIYLNPFDDLVLEGAETAVVSLLPGSGYQLGAGTTGTMVIDDDEAAAITPTVTLEVTDDEAMENDTANLATFTIRVSPPQSTPLFVSYATSGSAVAGTDYNAIGAGTTVSAGAAEQTVAVRAIDDAATTGTVTVGLQLVAGAGYTVGTASVLAVSILDDESLIPTATITASDPVATEGGDTATFTITFSRPLPSAIVLSPGFGPLPAPTAVGGGVDYDFQSVNPFAIPAGATSHQVIVVAIADAVAEGDEFLTLSLPATTASLIRGTPASATITVRNVTAGGGGSTPASSDGGGGGGGCGAGGLAGLLLAMAMLGFRTSARCQRIA